MTLIRVIALPASSPLPYPSQHLAQARPEFQLVTSDVSGKFNEIPGEGGGGRNRPVSRPEGEGIDTISRLKLQKLR